MPHPTSGLTDAQRRAVTAADPATGRLAAAAATCAALRGRGLAFQHPRSPTHYLTEAGRALRARLLAPAEPDLTPAGADAAEPAEPSGFVAATGQPGGAVPRGAGRAREVAAAWASLVQIRRLLEGDEGRPAPWERARPVHAVALALEAAGLPAASGGDDGGYRVEVAVQSDVVRVEWTASADGLEACAAALPPRGWQPTRHTDRSGAAFLLVSPAHRSR